MKSQVINSSLGVEAPVGSKYFPLRLGFREPGKFLEFQQTSLEGPVLRTSELSNQKPSFSLAKQKLKPLTWNWASWRPAVSGMQQAASRGEQFLWGKVQMQEEHG